jgi:hypothetical protein
MSRDQCLLRYGRCSVCFPCILKQLSAFRRTEVLTVENSCFTRNSWQAFSTRGCNISKSLVGAEYTEVFRCLHNHKSRGLRSADSAGQLTGPSHPIPCSPEVWFRCWQCGDNELVAIVHEPHVLSLAKRHMLQERLWIIHQNDDGTMHLLVSEARKLFLIIDRLRHPPRHWFAHISADIDFWTYVDWKSVLCPTTARTLVFTPYIFHLRSV